MTYTTFLQKVSTGEITDAQAIQMLRADNFEHEIQYYDLEMYFESLGRTVISDACEDYFMEHYEDAKMPEDDWEALMNYECERHPEWADEDNL